MPLLRVPAALIVILFLAASLPAQQPIIPHAQDRPPGPPSTPGEALKKMKVPPGFTVELVASEPMLVNPVSMTFDERGRVWVTESLEYPRSEAGPGRDRVKVLEDTDQDGAADKESIFLEGLNIPSGIAVGYGGVWVANSPDILFVQDTDGDGKADKQEVVVTGFGRTDTHELPNSLTWGPDGWLYGLNGVFNYSHVKYPKTSPHYRENHPGWPFTCAMFRIHPRTKEFQVFAEGTSNPWGIALDNEGSAFISACVIDHLWHIVESGYYHRQGGPYPPFTWKIDSIVKHKHQKAAYCGIHFFDSDAYPDEYRNKLYMGNIHGNCINVDKLQRDGSTYFATGEPDFLSANDAWFMPVAQKTGPDGCLYVLDWYDQYHCYQDARRDPQGIERAKGRLYRVRYKDSPRAPAFDLAKESDDQLIGRLDSANVYFRDIAQRLLAERNDPQTRSKLQNLVLNDFDLRKARLHALWALAANGFDELFLLKLLNHSDASLRAWGVRVAGNSGQAPSSVKGLLPKLVRDASPDVRLQVAIAADKLLNADECLKLYVDLLSQPGDDKLIPHIVWQNLHPLLERHSDSFIQILQKTEVERGSNLQRILSRVVDRILGTPGISASMVTTLFEVISAKDSSVTRELLQSLAARVQSGELKGERLEAVKSQLSPILAPLIKAGPAHPLGDDATLLSVSWKDPVGLERARFSFSVTGLQPEVRIRSLDALIAAGDTAVLQQVATALRQTELISPRGKVSAADFHGQVLASLGRLDSPKVAEVVLAAYPSLAAEVKPKAIELLTQRAAWAKTLLKSLGREGIPHEALNQTQVRKLLAVKDPELAKLVTEHWGTIRDQRNPARVKIVAEMRKLIRTTPGDALRGQEVNKKLCGQCHKLYGEGQEVGPDITLNGRNSFEQLLSNVFDPSLVIGAAYQGRIVLTKQGKVLSGLLVEDSPQRIVLKVQGGKQEIIPREDVDEFKVSELSLMPEDVEKTLKPQEIVDLFAFLTLDKPPSDPTAKQLPGVKEVQPRATNDPQQFGDLLAEVAPGFTAAASGEGGISLLREFGGRSPVVKVHPVERQRPCVLSGQFALPEGKKSRLLLSVAHHPKERDGSCDFRLIVKVNGETLHAGMVSEQTAKDGWLDLSLDLSKFGGQTANIELHCAATGWFYEFAYWNRAEVVTE